jgi:hypothetical protein
MKHPPKLVCALCYGHDAWVVGGAARDNDPRDWDILVPFSQWQSAAFLIPSDAKPNSFGGFKCSTPEGVEVDVWPGDIGKMITFEAFSHLWHPRTNFRWQRVKEKD